MEKIKVYTRKEVAAIFGIQPRTVLKWEKRGVIKPNHYVCGRPRYLESDVLSITTTEQLSYKKPAANG